MEFPAIERVVYTNNPLAEVVCQIRFPRILAIDERIPADFQQTLGSAYPYVETREVVGLVINSSDEAKTLRRTHYDFITEDRRYQVTITSDFLAVQTHSYEEWGKFEQHIKQSLDALTKTYSVPFFTRIGLRYVNVLSRKKLGLEGARWRDLLKHSALGLLVEDEVPIADVTELSAAIAVKLDEGGNVIIRTSLTKTDATGDEPVFVIDNDFFSEETIKGSQDAAQALSRFNNLAGRAFRWFIERPLQEALGPIKSG